MTIRFGPHFPSGNRRGQVQLFIENNVDRDNDFYTSAVSKVSGNHVIVRVDFHPSPSDPQHHMTGDVFIVSPTAPIGLAAAVIVAPLYKGLQLTY